MQFTKCVCLSVALSLAAQVFGQSNDTSGYSGIVKAVTLDSITVLATKRGFDVADFIGMVRSDTTFHQSFRNLRLHTWQSENNIKIYQKRGKVKASYYSRTKQPVTRKAQLYCRVSKVDTQHVAGKFFKKDGEHAYYTSELFWYLFYTPKTVCEKAKSGQKAEVKGNELRKHQLKTLIFNPGSEIEGVPLIKKKMAIFDEKMTRYYNYHISSQDYNDSMECYVFSVTMRDSLPASKEDKVVIKRLVTWFSKADFSIVSRQYDLSYFSALFDFDVKMDVKLRPLEDKLIVEKIHYDGFWDIPFRKPEIAKFNVSFDF